MVLAIPFFPLGQGAKSPSIVAFIPSSQIRKHSRGFRCQPASFKSGQPHPRRDFKKYFDEEGIKLMENDSWSKEPAGNATVAYQAKT
jgi:hypothetical protein